ncbi:MAG: acetyl-CoA carboxylase carboxyltransferase subunit beta [Ruminococcaceae bacterium]|nr:acetyl-CoA carboxylase carboxyltransferase subunit beta [Oscillospiraceae bacterium]
MLQFKKPRNELEGLLRQVIKQTPAVPDEMFTKCPGCSAAILSEELKENHGVCVRCGHHFPISARERIALLCDAGSFSETERDMENDNPIDFPGYPAKKHQAKQRSSEKEAVITGTASIGGYPCALFVMEGSFMMGSMGSVVGEKITRLFELACDQRLPVIGVTVSGGARMQEGILSLMQMAKTSGAVRRHSDEGLLYIPVLTNPTTGGVTASFAMEGDIILAEPGALIAFAGPRVIEQTTRQKLPGGFQKAEFLLEHGFLDAVVPRGELAETLTRLLRLHVPAERQLRREGDDA